MIDHYDPLTHEYPPTDDLAVATMQALAKRTGWLVLDPSSDELVERIAEALYAQDAKESEPRKVRPWGELGSDYSWVKEQYRPAARAVLRALASPGGAE